MTASKRAGDLTSSACDPMIVMGNSRSDVDAHASERN